MTEKITHKVKTASLWIFLGLLAYMPLHILLSTWLGTSFQLLDFAKIAKDGVLIIGFLLALGVSVREQWFRVLLRDKLVWIILAYAGLTLFMALIKPTDQDAELLGLVYNTRFLVFFLYGMLLVHLFPEVRLQRKAVKTVLVAGGLVILFGLMQYFVLPNNALTHVGYSRDNGVLPAFFIDEKPDLERVMSTLRDPNSLGSYLIIISMVAASVLLAVRRQQQKIMLSIYMVLGTLSLWLTFSRSALLGFALAGFALIVLSDNRFKQVLKRRKKVVIASITVAVMLVMGGLFAAKDTYLIQNVVFHADQSTVLEDPNELRVKFFKESVAAVADQPEGTGPGTAGLASIRNNVQGTTLNENYYLQIATEVGIVGLLLFISILIVVGVRLYRQRSSLLAIALLASFIGLAFTNLLVHIWSNEAVAYTWWGLAGLLLAGKVPTARPDRLSTPVIGSRSLVQTDRIKEK